LTDVAIGRKFPAEPSARKGIMTFNIDHVYDLLVHAKAHLRTIEDGTAVVKQGANFGDLQNDTELRADRKLGEHLRTSCQRMPGVARISIEGLDDWTNGSDGLWVCIDPIDGSLNYKSRGRSLGGPFTTVVTVVAKSKDATFDDIIAAGVIDLRPESQDLWLASKDERGRPQTLFKSQPATTLSVDALDPGSQIVMVETYYPENREKINQLFAGQKGNFSRFGSAAYEMACVANGVASAFLCDRQKQHELGAAYLLTIGAGGMALDWDGNLLNELPYEFNRQTSVILAANLLVAKDILLRMERAWPRPMP